jgi:hypothetical protein
MHCSKVTIRDARSATESKKAVLGQPNVVTSDRTLRGSSMRQSNFFNIALCCYNENIWHGQLVFRVDRRLTHLRE